MSSMRFDGRVAIVTGAGGKPGLGRSHAMLLAERGAKGGTGVGLDRLAGVGELDVDALLGGAGAARGDVGNQHVGQRSQGGLATLGTRDLDGRAVHVELAVTDLVHPGPGESGLAVGDVGGDLELVLIRGGGGGVVASVTGGVAGRAATLDRVDDLEGALLVGLGVVGDGDLARAAAVDGLAGEAHLLLGALLHLGGSSDKGATGGLAGEVAAIDGERAVGQRGAGVGGGDPQEHVSLGGSGEATGDEEGVGEVHVGESWWTGVSGREA